MSEGACSCPLSCRQPYTASHTGCTKTPESLYGFRRNGCTKSAGISTLLSNDPHFTGAGMELSCRTAEVARRQPDGTWKYVIDHPYAAADLPAE
jgi:hypothetical protein